MICNLSFKIKVYSCNGFLQWRFFAFPCSCVNFQLSSESYVTTDSQSASLSWNKASIWGLRPDFYYCQTVAGLLVWGALSDKRMGLLFTIAAGARQHHIFLSLIRDFPFRCPLKLAGLQYPLPITSQHGPHRKHLFYRCVRVCCSHHLAMGMCLLCCCPEVGLVYLPILWSLHRNGPTHHNIVVPMHSFGNPAEFNASALRKHSCG
jgi:hypothetical protein